MSGWKQWQIAEEVLADEFQSYVQDQVVQVYADSTARGTALGTAVSAGMMSYLTSSTALQFYNGSSWQNVSQVGDITAVTAGTGLTGGGTSGDVTLNVNYAAVGSAITIGQSQVTNLTTDLAGKQATITGGTAGQAYISNGTAAPGFGNVLSAYVLSSIGTVSASTTAYTATATNENNTIVSLATATCTVTVPNSAISVGDRIDIVRDGAGTVVIAAGSGVTSWAGAGTAGTAVTFKIDQQYNAATVIKTADATYRVIGRITA